MNSQTKDGQIELFFLFLAPLFMTWPIEVHSSPLRFGTPADDLSGRGVL
jgi:hypothetical protein